MKNKLLLIIDPQIDFITGTLAVAGAAEAMDRLAHYIAMHGDEYNRIIATADRHPMRHCSFRSYGGKWPGHCVADSVGAAIWPAVMEQLEQRAEIVLILHKGEREDTEEYSILKNREARERIISIIESEGIGEVDICGIAGDVCVAETIRDWLKMSLNADLKVLKDFTASIDGGKTIEELMLITDK